MANNKENVRVFVYGSLKKHLGNHPLLERLNAKFLGFDMIIGKYTMVSFGGFPAVCKRTEGEDVPVYGEVYSIQPEQLDPLDALEGHPRWYCREKLRTEILEKKAWIYLQPESAIEGREIVPQNMWRPTGTTAHFWHKRSVEFPNTL